MKRYYFSSTPAVPGRVLRGYTLMELLVVVVVVSIITTISVSHYNGYIERMRGRNAEAFLVSLYNQQKRYKIDTGVYYTCDPCSSAGIETNLGLDIQGADFTYTIQAAGAGYTATATRTSGSCASQTITITNSTTTATKSCSAWQ